jgi:hypothetical protein
MLSFGDRDQESITLNEFNHVRALMGAISYEEVRLRYCARVVATENKVEDAITGNELQIKEQLIFMEAMQIIDGCNPAEFMTVRDVPQLVKLLTQSSPRRSQGAHAAHHVLCRAGPGTGKTWMVKQSLYLLASELSGRRAGDGIRLVPLVVFVQRIVRLLTELGGAPATASR